MECTQLLGSWYVVQYYASSEEALSYGCMRPVFFMSPDKLDVSMNFTYTFTDDPTGELLYGNITWDIPDPKRASHWVHAEDICKTKFFFNLSLLVVNLSEKFSPGPGFNRVSSFKC